METPLPDQRLTADWKLPSTVAVKVHVRNPASALSNRRKSLHSRHGTT